MERINLSTYVPKSPQQKQLVEYEKLLQQSEKDFESLQNQFEELEKEKNSLIEIKNAAFKDVNDINKDYLKSLNIINIINGKLSEYLKSKWIKPTKLQNILKDIEAWKSFKNNS